MKIKKSNMSNMSYFAPSPKPVLSRCLLVLAVNDFGRAALFSTPRIALLAAAPWREQHALPPLE
jgi:hypothetical protein